MFAYYFENCTKDKHIVVMEEPQRDLLGGNKIIADFCVKGIFKKLYLNHHSTGSIIDLKGAFTCAKFFLKFLKKNKVI